MDNKNYYEILNIPKNASKIEIKKAYKKLVKKYHPDLYKGDKNFAEQKIKEINEAYDVLSNLEKKLEYDNSLNTQINYDKPVTNYEKENKNQSNIITNFIFEKLEHLNRKYQILIFIIILFLTLALFLFNLLGLRNYLIRNSEQNRMNPTNFNDKNNHYEYNYYNHSENHDNHYNSDIYNSIDEYFYEYFQSHFY